MKFNLTNIRLEDWNITGSELCQLTHKQIREKINSENFETFYTHLEMLRKHRYIAVLDENEREEANGSLKRNQKPSEYKTVYLGGHLQSFQKNDEKNSRLVSRVSQFYNYNPMISSSRKTS